MAPKAEKSFCHLGSYEPVRTRLRDLPGDPTPWEIAAVARRFKDRYKTRWRQTEVAVMYGIGCTDREIQCFYAEVYDEAISISAVKSSVHRLRSQTGLATRTAVSWAVAELHDTERVYAAVNGN